MYTVITIIDYSYSVFLQFICHAYIIIQCVFNYKPGEVFACVAGLCWITGHSYVVYGPLCNGGTTVLYDSAARPKSGNSILRIIIQ